MLISFERKNKPFKGGTLYLAKTKKKKLLHYFLIMPSFPTTKLTHLKNN